MELSHLMTSSDFNAIPLRCPFHPLAIVQVGFAGARSFVHLHVSEFLMKSEASNPCRYANVSWKNLDVT